MEQVSPHHGAGITKNQHGRTVMKRLFGGEPSRWPLILSWLTSGSKPLRSYDPELPFPGLRDGFAPHADCGLTDAKQCGKGTDGTGLEDCVLFFHAPDCAASWLKTSNLPLHEIARWCFLAAIAFIRTRLFKPPPQIAPACDLLCSCVRPFCAHFLTLTNITLHFGWD